MMEREYIDTHSAKWISTSTGVEMLPLRTEEQEIRVLLKFKAGCGYGRHRHPVGEEVFVLEGIYEDSGIEYGPGSYIYYPPGSVHDPTSPTGCTIMVICKENPVHLDDAL